MEKEGGMERRDREFIEKAASLPDEIFGQLFRLSYNQKQRTLEDIELTAVDMGLMGFWKRKRLLKDSRARNELGEAEYTARLREAEEQIHSARRIFQVLGLNDGLLDERFRESVKLDSQVRELRNTKTPLTPVPEL